MREVCESVNSLATRTEHVRVCLWRGVVKGRTIMGVRERERREFGGQSP